jgi:hypothetical protein
VEITLTPSQLLLLDQSMPEPFHPHRSGEASICRAIIRSGRFHKVQKHVADDIVESALTPHFWKRLYDGTPDHVLRLQHLSISYNLEVARGLESSEEFVVVYGCSVRRDHLRFKEPAHFSDFLKAYAIGVAGKSIPEAVSLVSKPVLAAELGPLILQQQRAASQGKTAVASAIGSSVVSEENEALASVEHPEEETTKRARVVCPGCGGSRHSQGSTCEFLQFLKEPHLFPRTSSAEGPTVAARRVFLELKAQGKDWRTAS